jgi:MYXO-CTERM domain-containing protein
VRRLSFLFLVAALLGAVPGAAPATAAGERTIAVVVDFGVGEGLPASFTLCVKEPAGATDAQALADALATRKLQQSTYSSSGLLCSIAGYPSTGCGVPTSAGYSYWAYFHGSAAGWSYASDGPAERTAAPGTAEGWRFERDGRGNPSDQVPTGPSSPTALCPSSTETPSTTLPAVTTTTAATPVPLPATASSTTTSSPSHSTSTTTPSVVHEAAARTAAAHEHASSPGSSSGMVTVAAGGLLALLGVVALVLRRRSRA